MRLILGSGVMMANRGCSALGRSRPLCLIALFGTVAQLVPAAETADDSVMYRCPGNDYVNTITETQAKERGCVKIEPVPIGWVEYARMPEGIVFEYNASRTGPKTGGNIETWVQVRFSTPRTISWADGRKASYSRSVGVNHIQCATISIARGVTYYFDAKGAGVWTDESLGASLPQPPDSVGEMLVRRLCAGGPAR